MQGAAAHEEVRCTACNLKADGSNKTRSDHAPARTPKNSSAPLGLGWWGHVLVPLRRNQNTGLGCSSAPATTRSVVPRQQKPGLAAPRIRKGWGHSKSSRDARSGLQNKLQVGSKQLARNTLVNIPPKSLGLGQRGLRVARVAVRAS